MQILRHSTAKSWGQDRPGLFEGWQVSPQDFQEQSWGLRLEFGSLATAGPPSAGSW